MYTNAFIRGLSLSLSGFECPDIFTRKSQVASDCEADSQVLYGITRHHCIRLATVTSESKNAQRAGQQDISVEVCNRSL